MRLVHVVALFFTTVVAVGPACGDDYGHDVYGVSPVPDAVPARPRMPTNAPSIGDLPHRGETMAGVRAARGAPLSTRGPVGRPPITRWNYDGYHVYFEHDRVIHTVVPADLEPVDHVDPFEGSP